MDSPTFTWQVTGYRLAPAMLCMAAIFWLSSRTTLPKPERISAELFSIAGHFGAYALLAVCFWWAFGLLDLSPARRMLYPFVAAVLYGLSDEWHQSFVPGRYADGRDIAVDAMGAAFGLFMVSVFARRRDGRGNETRASQP